MMGCDIHDYLETRDGEDQPWRKVGKVFPYSYYSPERESKVDEDGYEWNPQFIEHPFDDRNYTFFGVLADVRNGTGFAGAEFGPRVRPISQPRGLPDDVTDEVKAESEEYGVDGHSHSWLMLHELADYDWDQPYRYTGVMSAEQYEALQQGEQPDSWSGFISGPGIVTVTEAQYTDFKRTGVLPRIVDPSKFPHLFPDRIEFEGGKPGPDTKIYVQARWDAPGGLREAIGKTTMDKIAGLCDGYDQKNTRVVFWFDN